MCAPTPTDRHISLVDNVKPEDICACVQKFPRSSAGGGTGLTPTHLKEMLRMPEARDDTGLRTALACLVSQLARGKVPQAITPWFTGAPLSPLRNRDGAVRPIAVDETLRRLTSSVLMNQVLERAATFL